MPILDDESYVTGSLPVKIKSGNKDVELFAKELGYAQVQKIYTDAKAENKNVIALFISEAIQNKKGEKFTYDEVMRLRRETYETLCTAVIDLNRLKADPKK